MSGTLASGRSASRRLLLQRFYRAAALLLALFGLAAIRSFLGHNVQPPPRRITINRRLSPGGFHLEKEFILFVGEEESWAVSRRCTHLGCSVGYRELEGVIECPCHQSRFSPAGARLSGPATRDLPRYAVEVLRDAVTGETNGYQVTIP